MLYRLLIDNLKQFQRIIEMLSFSDKLISYGNREYKVAPVESS